jgi:mannose-1-phosphate guanylyltransferase/phosphomannomutase
MKAVIMAGGFGTRLRPLTINLPKPMAPVINKPMMEHILEILMREGIKEIISLLYFQPESIENHFGDGSAWGVRMNYIGAAEDLGTAGSVKNAEGFLNEPFIIISGDVLTDFDLSKAIAFHRERKALATMVLTRVENPLAFGIVITEPDGRVSRFLEKPSWGEVFSDTINTGIYILEPGVLKYTPKGKEFDFSKDLFPLLLRENLPLYGYIADGYWKDIGNLTEYRLAHRDILEGRVRVNIPGEKVEGRNVWLGKDARVDFTAKLTGSVVIGENCMIGPNVRINNSVIGRNCVVEEGASISDSVIWDDAVIGKNASLQENVVGRGTMIKENAFLGIGAIVSDHCKIGKGSIIKDDVKVWPSKVVEDGATLASSLIWGERWSKSIFGAYGVTGLANYEISPEFAAKLGAAYGASLGKGAVVSTSRDSHKTSRMINRAIMTGILSTGVNVYDFGVAPMPVVRFQAGRQGDMGGVHTRKSPFDPELVDIKFFDDKGMDLASGKEKTVERLFFGEDFRRVGNEESGEISFPVHGVEYYQNGFLKAVDTDAIRRARPKIVIDYAFGSSTKIFPPILGKLGCEVIALNANLDSTKLTRTAEEFQKSLDQLSHIVVSLQADIGVYLDAGGEKTYLIDEKGDVLSGDPALQLVTLLVLKTHNPATIAVPVTATRVIDDMAAAYGFNVKRTKTSARHMMEMAREKDVVFVGEEFGGFIFPAFQCAFDGMYAIAKILEMMATKEVRLHQLMREVPPSHLVREIVPCPWEKKGIVMRQLIEYTKDKEVVLLDGIKVFYGKDWVAAYPSSDHAYFHVYAEGGTMEGAKRLAKEYIDRLNDWQK